MHMFLIFEVLDKSSEITDLNMEWRDPSSKTTKSASIFFKTWRHLAKKDRFPVQII